VQIGEFVRRIAKSLRIKRTAKDAKSAKKKNLGNVHCQHFLGALGVLGGKKCDFAVLLGKFVRFTPLG